MTKEDLQVFQDTIRFKFGCEASYIGSVDVSETYGNGWVWTGEMHQFAIDDFQGASHCYAWIFERPNGTRAIPTVLKTPKVNTAQLAFHAFVAESNPK